MTRGFLFSLGLHILIILAFIYGLPDFGREIHNLEVPLIIDVVAEETLTLKPAPRRLEVKPQPQPDPTPIPKPEVTPPEKQEEEIKEKEPEKTPEPELKPKIVEEPPKPDPVPEVDPKEKVEEVPDKITPVPRSKPIVKPAEKTPKKKEDNRFSDVLKDLKKMKEKTQVKGQDDLDKESDNEGDPGKLGDQLSVSEIDAVRAQLAKCWNVPAGAKDAKDLKVKIHLWMNPDASVNKAVIVKDIFLQSHPFYKIAADRALNAVLDKNCNPLPLPKKKYDLWKEMVITFDPKEMLG